MKCLSLIVFILFTASCSQKQIVSRKISSTDFANSFSPEIGEHSLIFALMKKLNIQTQDELKNKYIFTRTASETPFQSENQQFTPADNPQVDIAMKSSRKNLNALHFFIQLSPNFNNTKPQIPFGEKLCKTTTPFNTSDLIAEDRGFDLLPNQSCIVQFSTFVSNGSFDVKSVEIILKLKLVQGDNRYVAKTIFYSASER